MSKLEISVTILTLNEEANLARAIKSVEWAKDVLVVDSGSTDRTQKIAEELGTRFISHPWKNYGHQKNFAQSQALYDWVLNIDADEAVSPELAEEISRCFYSIQEDTLLEKGFLIPRKTFYLNRWILHGGWYPNYLLRFANRHHGKWTEPHVHEELKVNGPTRKLHHPLLHYTFQNIEDQIKTNLRYSRFGYEDLKKRGKKRSLLKLILKPIGKFIETYLVKRGFLDGMAGFIISINAAHSMFLKYAYFYEERDSS